MCPLLVPRVQHQTRVNAKKEVRSPESLIIPCRVLWHWPNWQGLHCLPSDEPTGKQLLGGAHHRECIRSEPRPPNTKEMSQHPASKLRTAQGQSPESGQNTTTSTASGLDCSDQEVGPSLRAMHQERDPGQESPVFLVHNAQMLTNEVVVTRRTPRTLMVLATSRNTPRTRTHLEQQMGCVDVIIERTVGKVWMNNTRLEASHLDPTMHSTCLVWERTLCK